MLDLYQLIKIKMRITVAKKETIVFPTLSVQSKKNTYHTSTTFSGCYMIEKINNTNMCFIFDRGMAY